MLLGQYILSITDLLLLLPFKYNITHTTPNHITLFKSNMCKNP